MHLLSRVGTFQGRKAASALSPFSVWAVRSQHRLIMLRYNSISLFHVFISFSHTPPHFLCPLHSHHTVFLLVWPFVCFVLPLSPHASHPPPSFSIFVPVALYAISAVYFAGVMVRLMLTLTPVVCMLSAVAFSSVFEHYMGDDTKREKPPAEDSSDEDDKRNSGNLYDKVKTELNDCRKDKTVTELFC